MAAAIVEHCLLNPGIRIVCIREVQKTLAQSAKMLIENNIQEFGVGHLFRVLYELRHRGDHRYGRRYARLLRLLNED